MNLSQTLISPSDSRGMKYIQRTVSVMLGMLPGLRRVAFQKLEDWVYNNHGVQVALVEASNILTPAMQGGVGGSHLVDGMQRLADFANFTGRIPDGFDLINRLYGDTEFPFVYGFLRFQEGIARESLVFEEWQKEDIPTKEAERLLYHFLRDYPNYVLNNLLHWATPPEDFLIRRKRVFDFLQGETGYLLDIGCSYNPWIKDYLTWDYMVGMDLSLMSLKTGRLLDEANKSRLVNSNAQELPFRNTTFDIVVSSEVLEHVPQPEQVIREMYRLLRTNGAAVLSVPMHVVDKIDLGVEGDPTHRGSFYSFEEICEAFKQVGFTIEGVKKDPYYIFKLRKR